MRSASHVVVGLLFCVGCATASGDGADAGPDPSEPDAATTPTEQPDAGPNNNCTNQPCDLSPQCGCASGEACDLDGSDLPNGGTTCRSVTTMGQDDASCNSLDDCAAGYVCLGNPGQCRRYCQDTVDCGAGGYCLLNVTYDSGGGNFMDVPGASTCTKSCQPDPQTNNGCPDNFGCRMFRDNPDGIADNGDEYFLTDCQSAPATGGGLDTDCTANSSADCAVGFTCVTINGTDNLCKETCIVGDDGTCGTGTCAAFADPQPIIGGVTYGFCQ